jgi:hypothetical protein
LTTAEHFPLEEAAVEMPSSPVQELPEGRHGL